MSKISSKLMRMDWLFALAGFFLGVTNKQQAFNAKPQEFINNVTNPVAHFPVSIQDYWNRLKTNQFFIGGLVAWLYGAIAPMIKGGLPFTGPARKLGSAIAVGSAIGAVIDDPPATEKTSGAVPSLEGNNSLPGVQNPLPLSLTWEA